MEGPVLSWRQGNLSHWLCVQHGGVVTINHLSACDSVIKKTVKTLFSFQQHLIQTEHDLIYLQTAVIIFCSLFCLKGWLQLASCQTHLAIFDSVQFLKRSGLQASNKNCQWHSEIYRFALYPVGINPLHLLRNLWDGQLSWCGFCTGLFLFSLLNLLASFSITFRTLIVIYF